MMHQVLVDILTTNEIGEIARQYRDNTAFSLNVHTRASIKTYVETTLAYELWRVKNPIVLYVDGQPYQTTNAMREDLQRGILKISVDYNVSPVMSPDVNLKFRAMYDLQHCRTLDCNFNLWGEICAYMLASRQTHDDFIRDWLFSEIVGQVCYLRVFGEFPVQRVVLIDSKFRLKCERVYNGR